MVEVAGRVEPRRVMFAHECSECPDCGEPYCDVCDVHYEICNHLGPDEADDMGIEYEMRDDGESWTVV